VGGRAADAAAPAEETGWHGRDLGALALVVAAACVSFFPGLGLTAFWSPSEGRVVEIAREMIETGDYVLPRINGRLALTKPPLVHWITCFGFEHFGYTETVARFPCALLGVLAAVGVFMIGRKFFGTAGAAFAGVALALAPDYVFIGRGARIDGPLVALVTWSSFFLICSLMEKRTGRKYLWAALGGLLAGLGVLAKGPVGLLIPSLTVLALLLSPRLERKGALPAMLLAFAVCLATALPWYLAVLCRAPREEKAWFFSGQLGKWLAGKKDGLGKKLVRLPLYLPYLAKGFFPWSLILPAGLVVAFRETRSKQPPADAADSRLRIGLRVALVWFLGGLILFSFSSTKAARYVLPLYPAAALLVGFALVRCRRAAEDNGTGKWLLAGVLAGAGVVVVGFATLLAWALWAGATGGAADRLPASGLEALMLALGSSRLLCAALAAVAAAAMIAAAKCVTDGKASGVLAGLSVCGVLLICGFNLIAAPKLDAYNSPKAFAAACGKHIDADTELYWFGHSQRPLHFYLGRNFKLVPAQGRKRTWQDLLAALAEDGTAAVVVSKEGKPMAEAALAKVRVLERGFCGLRHLYLVTRVQGGETTGGARSRPSR